MTTLKTKNVSGIYQNKKNSKILAKYYEIQYLPPINEVSLSLELNTLPFSRPGNLLKIWIIINDELRYKKPKNFHVPRNRLRVENQCRSGLKYI